MPHSTPVTVSQTEPEFNRPAVASTHIEADEHARIWQRAHDLMRQDGRWELEDYFEYARWECGQ